MWMSAEQLVKSYHKKTTLFALTLLHLQDCLALDSTGYRSTAYLLHKLKYTHLQMDTPPASCRVLWNSSPLTPPLFTGFLQKKGKSDFSKFNLQRMVFTLHTAKKENALVCECREIHPVSLQCHKVCQLIHTEPSSFQRAPRQELF